MNSRHEFCPLSNGMAVPWTDIPEWPASELVNATAAKLGRGGRLSAWFGVRENIGIRLVAVIAFDAENTLAVARSTPTDGSYP